MSLVEDIKKIKEEFVESKSSQIAYLMTSIKGKLAGIDGDIKEVMKKRSDELSRDDISDLKKALKCLDDSYVLFKKVQKRQQ